MNGLAMPRRTGIPPREFLVRLVKLHAHFPDKTL
jgi:hypothetical protein